MSRGFPYGAAQQFVAGEPREACFSTSVVRRRLRVTAAAT